MIDIAVLFHRLGPYHRARLRALASTVNVRVLEYSKVDSTYAWDVVESNDSYPVLTAFEDAEVETQPIGLLRARIHSILDRMRPSVVAIPGWSSKASLAALEWCCLNDVPCVLMSDSAEQDEPRVWWKERIKKAIVRLYSTALVAGKPHVEYVEQMGLPRANIFTGYDVVDNQYFIGQVRRLRRENARVRKAYCLPNRYFLACSRFVEKKNLFRLLDAYASYVADGDSQCWDLVLLGDGPLRSYLEEGAEERGIADRVHFAGFRQYGELPAFYALAEAFIHASTTEQWGLVVNEAMAAGLPVLVSKRCGCALDLVQVGVNGYTFDPYDVDEIAKQMVRISEENVDRASMGVASQAIISQWSPVTFSQGMIRAAKKALSMPRKPLRIASRALLWALMLR